MCDHYFQLNFIEFHITIFVEVAIMPGEMTDKTALFGGGFQTILPAKCVDTRLDLIRGF